MPRWRKTIDITPYIRKDQGNADPSHIVWVARSIAALVRRETTENEQSFRLLNSIETMEAIEPTDDDARDTLNSALRELYDWADAERVWLGI